MMIVSKINYMNILRVSTKESIKMKRFTIGFVVGVLLNVIIIKLYHHHFAIEGLYDID